MILTDSRNNQLLLLLKAVRPRQWVKNLAVFAALIFNGLLFNHQYLFLSLKSFLVLCLVCSSTYLFNDLVDLESDQLHPFKKLRPLASGRLDKNIALLSAILSFATALILSALTSKGLLLMAIFFFLLQFAYTLFLKKIPVIDIITIAGTYILRAYTGEIVIGHHLSVWLMLSVVFLALFLATGKRKSELALLTSLPKIPIGKTRVSLTGYKSKLLDIYLSLFATSTLIAYGFYTFSERPLYSGGNYFKGIFPFILNLEERKWLMISLPFVLYGIMRYLQLIYEYGQGESPERLLFVDKSLLLTVIGWGISVVFAIYIV